MTNRHGSHLGIHDLFAHLHALADVFEIQHLWELVALFPKCNAKLRRAYSSLEVVALQHDLSRLYDGVPHKLEPIHAGVLKTINDEAELVFPRGVRQSQVFSRYRELDGLDIDHAVLWPGPVVDRALKERRRFLVGHTISN